VGTIRDSGLSDDLQKMFDKFRYYCILRTSHEGDAPTKGAARSGFFIEQDGDGEEEKVDCGD
jgi:hypothetical protein